MNYHPLPHETKQELLSEARERHDIVEVNEDNLNIEKQTSQASDCEEANVSTDDDAQVESQPQPQDDKKSQAQEASIVTQKLKQKQANRWCFAIF